MRRKVIDEPALLVARGVRPASVPDWLALAGDDADGVPGLPGFGAKSAAALLSRFDHIERIPDDARAWGVAIRGADALAETLAARRPEALLYRQLTTLVVDVPLAERLEDLRWAGVPRAKFLRWCEQVATTELRERPLRWA